MEIIHAIILGIVEGVTEFLPISSTFHLLFATKVLGLVTTDFSKFFDVFIQGGAILPVLIIYFDDWFRNRQFLKNIVLSFIPTAIVGFVLHKVIKDIFFESGVLMLTAFAVVGVVFIILEAMVRKGKLSPQKEAQQMTVWEAVAIGLAQALAVVPGVSRAGAVIVGMMLLGFKRDEAAKYSFSLAVPTILAAAFLDLVKMRELVFTFGSDVITPLLVGTVVAFLTSFIVLKWFINFLRQNSLQVFGIYRMIMAAVLVIFGFWR